ncbi:MAG TPA: hypothetical protein VNN18_04175 [Candidatus Xenobia bacterium]|nr:hypothetical protein [Candidatus Xenobia bacterium]
MPAYDVAARHTIEISASLERVYGALQQVDLARSALTRWLLALRGLWSPFRKTALTLADFRESGFTLVGEDPPRELLLGLVGKFWSPTGCVQRLDAAGFRSFSQPGFAKAAWSFSLEPLGASRTRLATETRIQCMDARSRRRFRLYWFFIGPFSGCLRREALRLVKQEAEQKKAR